MDKRPFILLALLIISIIHLPVIAYDVDEYIPQTKEDVDKLMDKLNPTTLDQLAEEVQSNVQQTLEKFQGGFMRSPDSPYYFLKSSSLTMIFKESEIVIRIPQYEVKNPEKEGDLNKLNDMNRQSPNIIGMTEVVLQFPGSNSVEASSSAPQSSRYNYFKGDESQWIRNSPYYQKLVYRNLYDNIDLVYDMSDGELKYEFLVHPGGDYHQIELEWLGDLYITQLKEGLVFSINTPNGIFLITDNNPINFIGKERNEEISGNFSIVDENSYGFSFGEYDNSKELIIDPKVDIGFSTFLGGSGDDCGYAIALDTSNNIYITGYTYDFNSNFPTTPGAYDETYNGFEDVFVTKISFDGSILLFSTLMGGNNHDGGYAIALDNSNNIFITGYTHFSFTTNFPTTTGAYNETHNGGIDVFVSKLSSDGSTLMFSTLVGGSGEDYGNAIALDTSNNVYITGYTYNFSTNFPTTSGAYDETHNGNYDVFVSKLSSDGSTLVFSTLMGGSSSDYGMDITLDTSNNIYITGYTYNSSTSFPTTPGAYDETHNGNYDVFVSKLSSDGLNLLFSTFLGGSGDDYGNAIVLDNSNSVYIFGYTYDSFTNFPTTSGAYDQTHNGLEDVFVIKISSDGSTLIFSTLLGGSGRDYGWDLTLDASNNVYIIGYTADSTIDFPTTLGAFNETHNGLYDVFVTQLSSDGSTLLFSTLIGGSSFDNGYAIALDSFNNICITGSTRNSTSNFPTTPGAYDETHNGGTIDSFSSKIIIEEFNPPNISGNNSLTYDLDTIGHHLNWNIGDINPGSFNITLDGSLVENQSNWYNGTITWNIDSLNLGIYNYTIHVYDYWGNLNEHSVVVNVSILNLRTDLWFSTLFGRSDFEGANAIILDSSNNIYIIGETSSTIDFPTTPGAYNETHNGGRDVFVTKLSSDGSTLLYSTLIGGAGNDNARALTLDTSNNVYIIGYTVDSTIDFPTTSVAYNETHNGGIDVFVTKLSSDGSTLLFSTLLGGSGDDYGNAIALDTFNNVYITGKTIDSTTNFPTTPGVYDETNNGDEDVFVSKLSSDGSTLLFSSLLGGSGYDSGSAIALDTFNNVYITGRTYISFVDFPTTQAAYDETHNGNYDVFVSKLSSDGSTLMFSALMGGSSSDYGTDITLDTSNNIYITGFTYNSSTNFPTTQGAYDETHNGNYDVFVFKLSSDGSTLMFSTLMGGSGTDYGLDITLDTFNNIYITGYTYNSSTNFPTTPGSHNETHNGNYDVFVSKLSSDGSTLIFSTLMGGSGTDYGSAIALDTSNNIYITGYTYNSSTNFPTTQGAYDETHNGKSDIFVTKISVEEFIPPHVLSTGNIVYELGSTDHLINWIIGDINPGSFNITMDGILVENQPKWFNGTISWEIDTLALGEYNYTIYLRDNWGNLVTDSVIITVEDTTAPELITPNNVGIEYKTIGNQLSWDIGDLLPNVYNITLDGEIYNSTTVWTNGTIISSIDNLPLGHYNFKIYVYDTSGNLISSTVVVTVSDTVKPLISSSQDITYELGSTDNSIYWIPSDLDPSTYQILFNSSEIESEMWNSSQSIVLDVDALYIGTHNFTIITIDGSGNRETKTIIVEVIDTTEPEIKDITNTLSNQIDLVYEYASIGNSITWVASDLDSGIYLIFHNGTSIKSGDWISDADISVTVNGYTLGSHNITIVITDITGNFISDTVIIQVVDTTDPVFDLFKNNELNGEVIAGDNMIILIEDLGGVTQIEYRWNDGDLITAYPDTGTLTLNQELNGFYFTIPVPEELVNTEATLFITAFDDGGNNKLFQFDVTVVSKDKQDQTPVNTDDIIIQLLTYIGYVLAALIVLLILRKRLQSYSNKKKLMKISSEIGLDGVYPDIFISFSSKDIKIGEKLFYKLHDNELNPWISSRKIQAGEDYSLKILDAIDNSKLFILLISKESIKSRHIKAELERAFSKEREIFPIRLDNSEIPKSWEYFLSTSQWIDVDGLSTKKWINEMIEIFKEKFGESVGDTIDNLLESFRSFEGDESRKG